MNKIKTEKELNAYLDQVVKDDSLDSIEKLKEAAKAMQEVGNPYSAASGRGLIALSAPYFDWMQKEMEERSSAGDVISAVAFVTMALITSSIETQPLNLPEKVSLLHHLENELKRNFTKMAIDVLVGGK